MSYNVSKNSTNINNKLITRTTDSPPTDCVLSRNAMTGADD